MPAEITSTLDSDRTPMTTTYFAYGSNMDPRQMDWRRPDSYAVGAGVLCAHRVDIFGRGYATVVPDQDAEVWGVLWEVTEADEAELDRYEGVSQGLYTREWMDIDVDGAVVNALVYVADFDGAAPPNPSYTDKLVFGAEHFGLPAQHVDWLRTFDDRWS